MDNTDNVAGTQNVELITAPQAIIRRLHISVEPLLFVLFFCYSLTDAASTNLILSRTCTMIFDFSKENCTGEYSPYVEDKIQPYTAKIIMVKSILNAVFPAILSLFIGSWSDNSKKRKPFLILPLIGLAIQYAIWLIFIYVSVQPMYFIFTVVPFSLTGGTVGLFTSSYSYLSDVTKEHNRAFRMSICSVFSTVGMLSGYLLSTEIYKKNHENVNIILFGSSLCCVILSLLYTIFLLPETLIYKQDDNSLQARQDKKSFFNLFHVKESINVLLKRRPSNGRLVLLLLMGIIVIDVLILHGESGFGYLSLKASFSWTAEDYNFFSAVLSGSEGIEGLVGIWLLNNILGLGETFIILIVLIVSLISTVLFSISKSLAGVYSSALFGSIIVLLIPLIKSQMSFIVPKSDVGKLFAFTSTLEAVTPFAASPAYTEVYNAVVSYKPLYIHFLSSVFLLIAVIFAITINMIHYLCGHDYQPLEEVPNNENETNTIQNPINA